ncbi:hypothetical protein [Levilactobacillus bambusae]|uniref:hypothetical protein n=1 Tax=Levilactobacillus bambusae TaxID=2024736 RepID=UPI001402B2A2|nr:hypothetical protein [Levilactobacillus bambusae]
MNNEKPVLKVEAELQDLEQIKELLLDIAALEKKYDVELTINYLPSLISETKL